MGYMVLHKTCQKATLLDILQVNVIKSKIWNKNEEKIHAMYLNYSVVIRNPFFITNYVREFSKYLVIISEWLNYWCSSKIKRLKYLTPAPNKFWNVTFKGLVEQIGVSISLCKQNLGEKATQGKKLYFNSHGHVCILMFRLQFPTILHFRCMSSEFQKIRSQDFRLNSKNVEKEFFSRILNYWCSVNICCKAFI